MPNKLTSAQTICAINIKINLSETGYEDVNFNKLAHIHFQW